MAREEDTNTGDSTGERRKNWVRAKFGSAEIEAQGALLILLTGMLLLQGVVAYALWNHLEDARASTIALRELVCLIRVDAAERPALAEHCAFQARWGMSEINGDITSPSTYRTSHSDPAQIVP